ncbi:MAG: sulfatase-like hydrolase/transferase [Acidobacteria bacterium]|nr:sulfatase-like hydrolase/transferase [Acidobacteriota bacterium]
MTLSAGTKAALAAVLLTLPASAENGPVAEGKARAPDERPNLVLILSDDHRWDALGAAGNPKIHTPVLDRLAREGVYFPQATIHVSQCPPSRATLLTGLPPHLHGMHSLQAQEPESLTAAGLCAPGTLPSLLREAGYRTALVGKWHLGPEPWECGFDEVLTWIPAGAALFENPDSLARGRSRELHKVEGFTQELLVDDAVNFVERNRSESAPYFLWLAVTAPHFPYAPNPKRIRKLYAGREPADLLPPGFPEGTEVHAHWVEYYEAVSFLDEQVGRLLEAVERSKRRTVIVFLGDNGYMMGERGIGLQGAAGKVVPYESSLRVPFLMAGVPGLTGTVPSSVSSLDLPPTLLSLAGVPIPATWPGRDLTKVLHAGGETSFAVSEWTDEKSRQFGSLAYRVIRTPHFKLIDWQNPEHKDELYDLEADPHERHNLMDSPDHAAILRDLSRQLLDWRRRTADPKLEAEGSRKVDEIPADAGRVDEERRPPG